MKIDCEKHDGSQCTLGLFGGKPSEGVCHGACKQRVPISGFVRLTVPTKILHPKLSNGPGDLIAIITKQLKFSVGGCGTCEAYRQQMNKWGWWGCWKKREQITKWLVSKAKEKNINIANETMMGLFKTAIKELWKAKLNVQTQNNS